MTYKSDTVDMKKLKYVEVSKSLFMDVWCPLQEHLNQKLMKTFNFKDDVHNVGW